METSRQLCISPAASLSTTIAQVNAYYKQTCVTDAECGQLLRIFLRAFVVEKTQDDDDGSDTEKQTAELKCVSEELMDQFADTIHPLVRRISHRLNPTAVHCIWMHSAQVVAKSWSTKLATLNDDLEVLQYLLTAWHAYQNAINLIHSLTLYAQNAILASNTAPPNTRVRSLINEMCCSIFVEQFIGVSKDRLFKSIVAVIQGDDEQVDTVKAVLQFLLYLDPKQAVYYRVFGLPYLAALKYLHCVEPTINKPDEVISYLKQAERTIEKENATANEYGFTLQLARMIGKLLYAELIASRRQQVCSYLVFEEMIRSHDDEQLRYLYQMVKYDDEAIKLLTANIERYLSSELGKINLPDYKNAQCTSQQAFQHVENIKQLYQCWLEDDSSVANCSFPDCAPARKAITSAFGDFLNSNAIHCCLLSIYVHITSLASCPWKMDPAIKMLALVEDKQAVTEYARYFLCHRIMQQLSVKPEKDVAEIGRILESLQIESPFSVKLILKNYKASMNQLNEKSLLEQYGQQFQIRLLNGLWKLDSDPITQTFRMPRSFWAMYNSFRHEFVSANPKKILQLNRNYGSAKLLAQFASGRITYQFVASLRQTVIMLLFNRHDSLSFEEIKLKAKLDTESLLQCVMLFLKYGLLLKCEESEDNVAASTFKINDNFSHWKIDNAGLAISINKLAKKADAKNNGIIQINWIKLQHECCPSFDLLKIMAKCTGDSSDDEPAPAPSATESNGKLATTSKHSSSKKGNSDKSESNPLAGTFRIEAAVVRVLKRATIVGDLKTLRDLTLDALAATIWTGQQKSPRQLASSLPLTELKKCVDSLEKNGYLRRLVGGEIVYEP